MDKVQKVFLIKPIAPSSEPYRNEPWPFIKNATKLDLLLQIVSDVSQYFSSTKRIISEIFDTAFLE